MWDNLRHRLDFDDLLFENRNRDYGAYFIRKKYNSAVITGIIIASLLVVAGVVIPFLSQGNSDKVIRAGAGFVQVSMENLQPPLDEIIIPPAPPPPEAARMQELVKYVPPVVVDTILPNEPQTPTNDEVAAAKDKDNDKAVLAGSGDDLTGGDGTGADEPLFIVEVMPSFKGGDITKFREWVAKRTSYPPAAVENKIKGTVFLTFIVEKDGSVSNVTIVKGVHPLLDAEAVKVISESPKWTPGMQRGQPVRVRYSIPMNFKF